MRDPDQQRTNEAAIQLLQQWLAETSGSDEAVWTSIKRLIEAHRLSDRPRVSAEDFAVLRGILAEAERIEANDSERRRRLGLDEEEAP